MTREQLIERCDQRILKLTAIEARMNVWRILHAFALNRIADLEREATEIMQEQQTDKMLYDALHNPDTNQPTTP